VRLLLLLLFSFLAAPASALDRDHLDVEVARIATCSP